MSTPASQEHPAVERAIAAARERLRDAHVDFDPADYEEDEEVLRSVRSAVFQSEWTDRTAAERLAQGYVTELVAVGSIIRKAEHEPPMTPGVVGSLRGIIRTIINNLFDR
ncbi:hypothetical protein ACLQ2Q_15790 [Microbacterium sp. DT81.1]|uniref:hypothetical protein n=1 Tax=Microbacterium sp. DT81.1 TaxID=3393413 RepID=UPI003CF47C3E